VQQNNPLSLYKDVDSNGYVQVEDSTSSVYKVRVKDFKDNDSWITINIKGEKIDALKPQYIKAHGLFCICSSVNHFRKRKCFCLNHKE